MSSYVRQRTERSANQFDFTGLTVASVRKFLSDVETAGISDNVVIKAQTRDDILVLLKAEETT